jgi:hypothetical protein
MPSERNSTVSLGMTRAGYHQQSDNRLLRPLFRLKRLNGQSMKRSRGEKRPQETEIMGRKGRNRIELVCWLGIAADLLVVFSSRPQAPAAAQAKPAFKTPTADVSPQACQPVLDQIVNIAREESGRTDPSDAKSLAALDQCIQRQEQVETKGCPADFTETEQKFLSAERSLCRDAHADSSCDGYAVQRAFFDVYADRSPYDSLDPLSDKIKHDLDAFQSAAVDFNQICANYGVN